MNRKILSWLGPLLLLAVVAAGVWYFVFRESSEQKAGRILGEARNAMELFEYKKAEQLLRQAIVALPNHVALHHNLAVVYLKQDRLEDARREFALAASLCGPTANEVRAAELFQVADIDVKREEYAAAESALQMAIAAHPTNRILHTRLIDLQLGLLEQPARADSTTRRFLRLCKPTPQNMLDAARVHYGRSSWVSAVKLATQAATLEDTLLAAHILASNAYWRAGQMDLGLEYVAGPLERFPNSIPLWVARGSLLIGKGSYDEALAVLDQALELDPRSYNIHRARMMAFFNAERYEESLEIAELCRGLTTNEDEQRFLRLHIKRIQESVSGTPEESGGSVDGGTSP